MTGSSVETHATEDVRRIIWEDALALAEPRDVRQEHGTTSFGSSKCAFESVPGFLRQKLEATSVPSMMPSGILELAALMRSNWDPVEKKLRCLKTIGHADVDEARRFLLAKVVELYVELDEAQAERFAAKVAKEGNKEVRKMVITWEDALAASKAEGEAYGESIGKAKGKAEATRDNILRILQQRFNSAPAFLRQELEAIQSLERLQGILDQAVVVSSVDNLVLNGRASWNVELQESTK